MFSHAPFITESDTFTFTKHNLFISITTESECHYGHGQTAGKQTSLQASLGVDMAFFYSGDSNYRKTREAGRLPNRIPMKVEQTFLFATWQGEIVLRQPDIGVLQIGAKADIIVFDGDSPNILDWNDPVAAVFLPANAGDVQYLLVDGRFREREFKVVGVGLG